MKSGDSPSNQEVVLRGDKKCPHGYTKRAACTTCDHEDDLKEKDAEIERLTALLQIEENSADTADRNRASAIAENDRLRAALERYGYHDHGQVGTVGKCPRWYGEGECTCGLSEALRGADTSSGAPAGAGTTLVRETSRSSGQGPERPVAWFRFEHEREPPIIAWGDWPPPVPDDTVWNPLYSTPNGRPAVEPGESHE